MNCRRARIMMTGPNANLGAVRRHVADCDECGQFAQRLEAIERALGDHHLQVAPPTGFAARIRTRLGPHDDPLAWAALRLLPATLGLVLLLSWLNFHGGESFEAEVEDPTTAVLNWVIDPLGDLESGS
ncbi:MAG: hypothetical protein O7A98_08295 [Acidobacteria bacterium]|nr:hypothetical protein [Acidobacteriota bacterium]